MRQADASRILDRASMETATDIPPTVAASRGGAAPGVDRIAADWRVNNFDLVRLLAALQVAVTHAMASYSRGRGRSRTWPAPP